jgi:hypothetical protein
MGHSQVGSFTVPLCSTAGRPTVRGCQAASSSTGSSTALPPLREPLLYASLGIRRYPLVPSGPLWSPPSTHQGAMLSPA